MNTEKTDNVEEREKAHLHLVVPQAVKADMKGLSVMLKMNLSQLAEKAFRAYELFVKLNSERR